MKEAWTNCKIWYNSTQCKYGHSRAWQQPQSFLFRLCRIVLGEVVTLELQDMSDQELAVLRGDFDKAAVESVGVGWIGDGIDAQHFEVRLEEDLAGKEKAAGENLIDRKRFVDDHANAARTEIDGFLDEYSLGRIRFMFKTNRQGDRNAEILTTICRRRLRSRGIGRHRSKSIAKVE